VRGEQVRDGLRSRRRRSGGAGGGGAGAGVRADAELAEQRRRQQVEAVAAIESDPFVRTLIEQFDARLDEAAITPKSPDTPAASPAANTGRDPR
jgi:hypothetical protein